jgi:signal transduction histidine kinase/CheY-like chemotaxis protein
MAEAVGYDPLTDRVRAEQVRLLYGGIGLHLLVTLGIAATVAFLLIRAGTLAPWIGATWIAVMATTTGLRLALRRIFFRANPPDSEWKLWARRFLIVAVTASLTWGGGGFWILAPGHLDLQLLFVATLIAVIYGGISAFGCYMPAFYALFLPAFLPVVAWFILQGDLTHYVIAGMFLTSMPMIGTLARRYNRSLEEALRLRFVNAALVEDLTAQRAFAEQASLAKSRFLASASHDLRQPVHALGMFVGALRSHRLPARSVALIDQIDGSVGALDSLFASLLDISKLDAGVVQGQPSAVALAPLLARICRDLEPEAAAKGVALILAPTELGVESDPLLLERVMRNLIGNAVRYTERGEVRVTAGRREGPGGREQVLLEVWDTGPGIAPDQQEAIFEEFYQISNPDRDRTKGLGLGLAIVRRLTVILGHDLSLESHPGRGSVFRVAVWRAEAVAAPPAPERPITASGPPGLILAIDDEAAVRAAMAELLGAWGHRVIAAASGDEASVLLAGETVAPDLIVCDYRLGGGEDGVAVIRRLQAQAGRAIPAILVTGDTAADRIREAQACGYPLLHKPLAHARLRATVTSLLRSAQDLAAE